MILDLVIYINVHNFEEARLIFPCKIVTLLVFACWTLHLLPTWFPGSSETSYTKSFVLNSVSDIAVSLLFSVYVFTVLLILSCVGDSVCCVIVHWCQHIHAFYLVLMQLEEIYIMYFCLL